MSAIPPNPLASVLQSPLAQGQAAGIRDVESAQRASAERRQTRAVDASDSTVETTDNDTQIYADAEGSGSQGRAFSENPQQTDSDDEAPSSDAPQGRHLDLEA